MFRGRNAGFLIPLLCAVVLAGTLLTVNATQYDLLSYSTESGWAVPEGVLEPMLSGRRDEAELALISVDMGDPIYVGSFLSSGYYLGADKAERISADYPVFARDGSVLYFLSSDFLFVTEDWDYVSSYDGLYLSEGLTYNMDGSRADGMAMLLVKVAGGYQLAQKTVVESTLYGEKELGAYSICAFGNESILCFSYDNGVLKRWELPVTEDSVITIGDVSTDYASFMKSLGLWEEALTKTPDEDTGTEDSDTETEETEKAEKSSDHDGQTSDSAEGGVKTADGETEASDVPGKKGSGTQTAKSGDKKESTGQTTGKEPPESTESGEEAERDEENGTEESGIDTENGSGGSSSPGTGSGGTTEKPAPPKENPNATPAEPRKADPPEDVNPDYQEPQVSFSAMTPWVYVVSTEATVKDPARRITGNGVSISVYKLVYENGSTKKTLAMRRFTTSTVHLDFSQLEPDTRYYVEAGYTYLDKYNNKVKVTIELGETRTLKFTDMRALNFSFYGEDNVPVGGEAVEIFGDRLQVRNLVFGTVANGKSADVDSDIAGVNLGTLVPETYAVSVELQLTNEVTGKTVLTNLDPRAVKLLKSGYKVTHCETSNVCDPNSTYRYKFSIKDRFGNEFLLDENSLTEAGGHTCKRAPSVQISAPEEKNVLGKVQLDVIWSNPDGTVVTANSREGAAMGSEIAAGIIIVKEGDTPCIQNALTLSAQQGNDTSTAVKGVKVLPVRADATAVRTSWTVTEGLEIAKNYTAVVLCGFYNNNDDREHYDTALETAVTFTTESLKAYGTISYTSKVEGVEQNCATLKFRMDAARNDLLLPLISDLTVDLADGKDKHQTLTLKRDELKQIKLGTWTETEAGWEQTVQIPVWINGEKPAGTAALKLSCTTVPDLYDGSGAVESVWDYLLASSKVGTMQDCWLSLILGSALKMEAGQTGVDLLTIAPKTKYTGSFVTRAYQGGAYTDISSGDGKKRFTFTTSSAEAVVLMDNAFISTSFIQLYGLGILDEDGNIQPDDSDRGGNNVLLKISEYAEINGKKTATRTVATRYINSAESYDMLKIIGLENEKDYILTVSALKYRKNGATELEYPLIFSQPQNEADPTVYAFTTGQSVVGDLSLNSVKQLYSTEDGESTTAISILDESDFYYGVWGDGASVYYYSKDYSATDNPTDYDKSYLEPYLDSIDSVEDTSELCTLARGERQEKQGVKESAVITIRPSTSTFLKNVWTSKYIPVSPGEEYSIFNSSVGGYSRITFFYRDTAGVIKYYTNWGDDNFMRGTVFRVPSTADGGSINADRICYMRISGYVQRDCSSLILVKYNDAYASGTELLTNMVKDSIVPGMYLSSSNTVGSDANRAYTADFIPVTGGSVYMIRGRDPNKLDDRCRRYAESSGYDGVLFYDEDHVFLGYYNVGYTTSLVKAPFGAAYCRFNIKLDQAGGVVSLSSASLHGLSMKLFREAEQGAYLVELEALLTDQSTEQLLREGMARVTLYTTTHSVTDKTDLEEEVYIAYGDEGVWEYTPVSEDFVGGMLYIDHILTFRGLTQNMGYKAVLEIAPRGWTDRTVVLDTVYFNTNRVVYEVHDLNTLMAIRNDPAGSYVVTADITGLTSQVLGSDRPFNGTIDFQGHSVTSKTYSAMFNRISTSGVVKNLVYNYDVAFDYEGSYNYISPVVTYNYGTMQNIVVNYSIENRIRGFDVGVYCGGIMCYNYGELDGFIVRLKKDIHISGYFGGVCYQNFGKISNGYVCGDKVIDPVTRQERSARIIHVWKYNDEVVSTAVPYVGYVVGYNSIRGTVKNTFAVGDLVIESDDASTEHSNADYNFSAAQIAADPALDVSRYETSTTNTNTAAVLVGYNAGAMYDSFGVGDRLDYDPDTNTYAYMVDRGAAVGYVEGLFVAENIVYFSQMDSSRAYCESTSALTSSIGEFNIRGRYSSLHDYLWYETQLGTDGGRFNIRDNVENGDGYFPMLILPECFPVNTQQRIELPSLPANTIEVLSNEVRVQGINEALVTLVVNFPQAEYGNVITDISIYDSLYSTDTLKCEILSQKTVGYAYRIDVLLSLGESTQAENSYFVGAMSYTAGIANLVGETTARTILASFWREIDSKDAWKSELCTGSTAINGNYLLTADLDFSENTSYQDWLVTRRFNGTLNGGIYSESEVAITDCTGAEILDSFGEVRKIQVWDDMTGMHTVSGVGNLDALGTYMDTRDYSRATSYYGNCLIVQSYGTIENMIFRDFESTTTLKSGWTFQSYYSGVVGRLREGARMVNCHVRDSNFYGCESVGSLVGNCTNSTIQNCSARNVTVESYRWTDSTVTASVGGLVGYCSGGVLDACFAADVTVTVPDLYGTNGVGGLAGYVNSSIVSDCYTTGIVNASTNYVGGVLGQMSGTSEVSGCWAGTTVITVSDYAGGIVGYHAEGVLHNCYTSSTVITRSFAATHVHRICHTTAFSETGRYGLYAFSGQYISYTDEDYRSKGLSSPYQFGIWDDYDGATNLLTGTVLSDPTTWQNVIAVGESYDLNGTAWRDVSGNEPTKVSDGYMPKLKSVETGRLLYDQPNVRTDYARDAILTNPYSGAPDVVNERVLIRLFMTSSDYTDIGTADFASLCDWESLTVIGGVVDKSMFTESAIPGFRDLGQTTRGGRTGREFEFYMIFGDTATQMGIDGHYLDSYIATLTLNHKDQSKETLRVRIIMSNPIYRTIPDIETWDAFFSQTRYANAFENIEISGTINFNAASAYSTTHSGEHVLNVRVNRLDAKEGTTAVITTRSDIGGSITFKRDYYSLLSQVVTSVEGIRFENITLRSHYKDTKGAIVQRGGTYRGIIGNVPGDILNCTFTNIDLDGGTSSCYGCIGRLGGTADRITMTNITVVSRGDQVGALAGTADSSATLTNITLKADPGQRNTVKSRWNAYVGGVVGYMNGIASDCTVTDTDVSGRSFVGGFAGRTPGDGGRPTEKKLKNITVGEYVDDTTPGATAEPNVTVTMDGDGKDVQGNASTTKSSEHRYYGGVVGYADGRGMQNLQAYNVLVRADYRSDVENTCNLKAGTTHSKQGSKDVFDETYGQWNTDNAEYRYFVGGISGGYGDGVADSTVKNCTVVSYGGALGGLCGSGCSGYNRVEDCLVYAVEENASLVGGMKGNGGASRSTVQHSVVVGGRNVGGYMGFASGDSREGGVIDTVVIGKQDVGGFAGSNDTGYFYNNYVLSSDEPIAIDLDAIVWPEASERAIENGADEGGYVAKNAQWKNADRICSGSVIVGKNNVGGLIGAFRSLYMYNNYVTSGVTVTGENNVGGAVGLYWGWEDGRWNTTNRSFYRNIIGADVTGTENVGGLIGYYSRYDNPETEEKANVSSAFGTYTGAFYSDVFTGNVTGSNCEFLVGAYDPALIGDWSGTWQELLVSRSATPGISYARVYEGSTLNGVSAADMGLFDSYDNALAQTTADLTAVNNGKMKTADRINHYSPTLTASADNLSNSNFYFFTSSQDYGGLGLSRETWSADTLYSSFVQDSGAATFSEYKKGIKTDSSLVLWLDARNNTGSGYTDTDSGVWTDLSGKGNDATLYWNGKTKYAALSMSEWYNYMFWNEGALEYHTTSESYYAELERSISGALQGDEDGYTVEFIYTVLSPNIPRTYYLMTWRDNAVTGGFNGYYGYNQTYGALGGSKNSNGVGIWYRLNSAGTGTDGSWWTWYNGSKDAETVYRTVTYTVGGKNAQNKCTADFYINGEPVWYEINNAVELQQRAESGTATYASENVSFRNTNSISWRLRSADMIRLYGVRVYNKALTAEERRQNAAYDQWYYFGGEAPEGANVTGNNTVTVSGDSGTLPSGQLFRNDVANYNGTLIDENYQTGTSLDSRGYYYTKSGSSYSDIVYVEGPSYGPYLHSASLSGEYYGSTRYKNVYGQEGSDSGGKLYSSDDGLYSGGNRMPDTAKRERYKASSLLALMGFGGESGLPELTAYASDADRINLELSEEAPTDMTCTVQDREGNVLFSGLWPEGGRTLTLTYDFRTDLTVVLECGEEKETVKLNASELTRTVMTYGNGYWYLCGTDCYDDSGALMGSGSTEFVHMMNGTLLDAEGQLWSAESNSVIGIAQPFESAAAQPLSSGSLNGTKLESFGTYLLYGSVCREQQLVIRDGRLYTMPASGVTVGSFVADAYAGRSYSTILSSSGVLTDLGDPLVYPDEFSDKGIRETNCTLGYSGTKLLVRYNSGNLVVFDYLTGETDSVHVEDTQVSFISFMLSGLFGGKDKSDWSSSEQAALTAAEYQQELNSDPGMLSALRKLKSGELDAGTLVEGETVAESDGAEGSTEADGSSLANGTSLENGDGYGVDEGDAEEEKAWLAVAVDSTAAAERLPAAEDEAQTSGGAANENRLLTEYVTVFDSATGTDMVYNVQDYLTLPEEELASEDSYAEALQKLGYQSAILGKEEAKPGQADGLTLVTGTVIVTVGLLCGMAILKKKKLDKREK